MTVRYRSRRRHDPRLRERLVALARERRRFGYRRLLIFLRREGFVVNHKRLFRLYREERLMVRKRRGRKRALGTRTPMPVPALPDELWGVDLAGPGAGHPRGMATRLQHRASALAHRLADARRLCRTARDATGPRRCAIDGLRALAPYHRSDRAVQPPDSGSNWIKVGGNV